MNKQLNCKKCKGLHWWNIIDALTREDDRLFGCIKCPKVKGRPDSHQSEAENGISNR